MRLFSRKEVAVDPLVAPLPRLRFASTAALERALDGTDACFGRYFFALYHCTLNEPAGIHDLRQQLRQRFPDKVTPVGDRFVLAGEAAFLALAGYHRALVECETLPDDFRAYAAERLAAITETHRKSQALPVPIDLTEGQLAQDKRLEFLTCVALDNRQIIVG